MTTFCDEALRAVSNRLSQHELSFRPIQTGGGYLGSTTALYLPSVDGFFSWRLHPAFPRLAWVDHPAATVSGAVPLELTMDSWSIRRPLRSSEPWPADVEEVAKGLPGAAVRKSDELPLVVQVHPSPRRS